MSAETHFLLHFLPHFLGLLDGSYTRFCSLKLANPTHVT